MEESFISLLTKSIKANWDLDALTDYGGITLQYKDLARKIEKLHILFGEAGIRPGDKIALCGRNSAHWAVAFLATLAYGAVIVPIPHEFKPDTIHQLVNHCEARLLFVGNIVRTQIVPGKMPMLEGIFEVDDFDPVYVRSEKTMQARQRLNELYGRKFPVHFTQADCQYNASCAPGQLAVINYTSGTSSQPKGVMIPYRSLYSNIRFAQETLPLKAGNKIISILPMAHVYSMSFELLYEVCTGMHVFFLTHTPSPQMIFKAFTRVKPDIVITVPLIIEKIIRNGVLPRLETPTMKVLLHLPLVSDKIRSYIREQMIAGFGGNIQLAVVGGAALNPQVEAFLKNIGFPYTVGYGMAECGPIICYEDWRNLAKGSCGKVVPRMEIRIDKPDPETGIGEILCRGENLMLGYYKMPELTQAAIDADGWLHTGDLGQIDENGNLSIKGRIKDILSSNNGQNIYPEEIEEQLNSYPLVGENLVVQRNGKLVALVYPDFGEAKLSGLNREGIEEQMRENRRQINQLLPSYAQIARIELQEQEFEKTPKRSIKRYLYS